VLRYNKTSYLSNVGVVYSNARWEPTFAYDIDPTVGSTAMPGFTELGALYTKYRVDSFVVKCSVVNKETFPVCVYVCPVNFDPGANTANYQNYLSNRDSKKKYLGVSTGNAQHVFHQRVSVASFAGSATATHIADYYSGGTSGTPAPANNLFYMLGSIADAVGVSGVDYTLDIDVTIEFFELASPSS